MPETIHCPQCQKELRIPDELFGKKVKCPSCGEIFQALPGGASSPAPAPDVEERVSPRREPAPREEEYQPPAQRRERPIARGRDDLDFDSGPGRRRHLAPHRGTLILVFGLLGLLVCNIFGIAAWVMGNNDLKEIRAGRMDPEGEGLTQAGRILGMIAGIFLIIGLVCGVFYILFIVVMVAGGAGGRMR